MNLEEKKSIGPLPQLAPHLQTVSHILQTWTGLNAAPRWDLFDPTQVDGVEFYVGSQELGHILLNGELHLAADAELRKPLLAQGLALRLPFSSDYAGWLLYQIRSSQATQHALWLFDLNYRRLTGTRMADLLPLISQYSKAVNMVI